MKPEKTTALSLKKLMVEIRVMVFNATFYNALARS